MAKMSFDKNTLIGVVAGSATVALCGFGLYLYHEKIKSDNRRDKQCQVYQPTKRHKATKCPPIVTSDKEVQAGPVRHEKMIQAQLPMVSKAAQTDIVSKGLGMKDTSCLVSEDDFGGFKTTASQAEEGAMSSELIASCESLDDLDVFYDARENQSQSREELLNCDDEFPKASSIMGSLRNMIGTFQSIVQKIVRSNIGEKELERSDTDSSETRNSK